MVSIKGDIPEATENLKGLMSADDKIKLDSLKNIEIVNDINEIIDDGIYIIDLPIFMKGKVNFINNSSIAVFNPPQDENINIEIDWGDGTIDKGIQKTYTHTYVDNTKSYNVIIKGDINTVQSGLFPLGFEEIELKKPVNLIPATFAQNTDMQVLKKLILPYGINQLPTELCSHSPSLIYVSIPNSVTTLDTACFYGCTGLTSIIIPDSVTNIGNNCFNGCTSLTSVNIPNSVTTLDTACFYGCTSLTNITIPSSVTSIGDNCFNGCTSLTSVTIPSSVTSIGSNCFKDCTSLTSITIPSSVTSIGSNCFARDTNLINYELYWEDSAIIQYHSTIIWDNTNTVFTIPNGQTANYITYGYPSDKLVERDE